MTFNKNIAVTVGTLNKLSIVKFFLTLRSGEGLTLFKKKYGGKRTIASFSIEDGDGSEKGHFEKAFAFFQTSLRLFQSAENVKCRRISVALFSWRPQSSLERERKIRRRLFTSPTKREIRHFHVVVVQ